jgi:hypothetical protein
MSYRPYDDTFLLLPPAPAACSRRLVRLPPDSVVTLKPQHLHSFATLPRNSLLKQTVSLCSFARTNNHGGDQ